MKYKFILTTLLSGYACAAMAQVNPVLVTDEVRGANAQNENYPTYKVEGQAAKYSYSVAANYNLYSDLSNKYKSALYTTASSGLVNSVVVEWINGAGLNKTLVFYGKDSGYTNRGDLYNLDNRGTEIGKIVRTTRATKDDYKDEVVFDASFRHFGMAVENEDVYISRITVTWKLAYSRENVTSGNLGTICLPYDVEAEQLKGVTVYSVVGKTTIDGQVAIVCEEVESMEAGQPYLFVAEGSSLFLVYSNPESYKSEPMSSGGFCGNFVQTKAGTLRNGGDADVYVVSNNQIRKAGDDVNIGANRAYFRMNALPDLTEGIPAASSPRFVLSESGFAPFGGEHPTLVETPSALMPASATYDLSGRQVHQMQPGISIRGGKKRLE